MVVFLARNMRKNSVVSILQDMFEFLLSESWVIMKAFGKTPYTSSCASQNEDVGVSFGIYS